MKKIVTGMLAGSLAFYAAGHPQHGEIKYENDNRVSLKPLRSASNDTRIDLVLFYRNSYAETLGEYAAIQRMENMVNEVNALFAFHGGETFINVVDIMKVPQDIIPDSLRNDTRGEDGVGEEPSPLQLLGSHLLNEFVGPDFEPSTLYPLMQNRWRPDMYHLFAEYRGDENAGGFSTLFMLDIPFIQGATTFDRGNDISLRTFFHEVGHSVGLDHDIEDVSDEHIADNPDAYNYAWSCGGQGTVLNTNGGTHLFYSSPDITVNNEPCGNAFADNARAMRENVSVVANVTDGTVAMGSVTFTAMQFTGSESEGVTIDLVRDGDISLEADVKVLPQNGSAVYGEDFDDVWVLGEFAAGEATTSVVLPMIDDGLAEGNESLTVKLDYGFRLDSDPAQVATISIVDSGETSAGAFSLSVATELVEGQTTPVTITRDGGEGEAVVMLTAEPESPTNGATEAGDDYVALNETITFAAGEVTQVVDFVSIDDDIAEDNGNIVFTLSSEQANVTIAQGQQTVTLIDNDATAGEFSLSGPEQVSEGAGSVDITVTRAGGSIATEVVVTSEVNGVQNTQTVSFAADESSQVVVIAIEDNTVDEANYTLSVTLSSSDETATFGTQTIQVVITDNDTAPATPSTPTQPASPGSSGGGSVGAISLLLLMLFALRRKANPLSALVVYTGGKRKVRF